MSTVLPDAAPANWVDRYAPVKLRPWLKLARFDRPTGIWLLMLPGWQGIALACAMLGRAPNLMLLALFFAGAVLMRSAGCAYNDIVDRRIDALVARTAGRPIPSGQITVRAAWAFVIGCALASLVILLSLNLLAVSLGVVSLALVAAYPFMKRITWWPQAWLGLTFNWGALLGFAAALRLPTLLELADQRVLTVLHPAPPWVLYLSLQLGRSGAALGNPMVAIHPIPPLLLYAAGVFWTLGYDTIYAVQDLEDDALIGVKSSARRLGASAPQAVLAFYFAAAALAFGAAEAASLGWLFWPLALLFVLTLLRQPLRLKLDDPAAALALFKSNTLSGALLFLAIAAGAWRAGP